MKGCRSRIILQALFDLCLLADSVTEVIKFRPANLTFPDRCNRNDRGGMYGENLLTSYAVGNAADRDSLINATVLLGNDGAFKCLGTLAASFNDLDEDTHSVADVHLGKFGLHVLLAQNFNKIHIISFLHIDVHTGGQWPRQRTAFLVRSTAQALVI